MSLNFPLRSIHNSPPSCLRSPVASPVTSFPLHHSRSPIPTFPGRKYTSTITPRAKFDLSLLLGGRGLCNGEAGLQQELNIPTPSLSSSPTKNDEGRSPVDGVAALVVAEDGFEKELMGLTGGFPGGEKGLKLFLKKNPPLPKKDSNDMVKLMRGKKPRAPELPLLMPGMITIVKNPHNPYYMYCGIVQRITDGKAGVLFEGGNWDRMITFRLEELERREKGPPMKNPRSVILEQLVQQKS